MQSNLQNTVPLRITFLSVLEFEELVSLSILTMVSFSLLSSNADLTLLIAFSHNCELVLFNLLFKSRLAKLIRSFALAVEVFCFPLGEPAFDSIIHKSLFESTAIMSKPFLHFFLLN